MTFNFQSDFMGLVYSFSERLRFVVLYGGFKRRDGVRNAPSLRSNALRIDQ